MTTESAQDAEELQLPNELVYEPVMRRENREFMANRLAFYVLRQWKRSIPKVVFRPPVGYLEPICFMPVDIFYEILEHLHPIDLYHISQVNWAFRALLSHPNSSSVWNLAFENHPALPKYPPETLRFPTKMSGLEWAGMLFGKYICGGCGGAGTPPNIPFRRFQCISCSFLNDRLVDLKDYWISEEPVAFTNSQTLYLTRGGELMDIHWDPLDTIAPRYVHSEAEVVAARGAVSGFEDAIRREEPGASEAFDAYKAKRKAEVDPTNKHFATYLQWAGDLRQCYSDDLGKRITKIMKRIRSRFRRLGYHPEDVGKAVFDIILLPNSPRLSNKRWEAIKPVLEPAIIRAKNERRTREHQVVITKRKDVVHELYREYKKSVPPLTWAYLPPHYAVYQFKPFAELINAPHDDELKKDLCEDALRRLPKEIENWMVAKKRQLVSLLPGRGNGASTTSVITASQPGSDVGRNSGTSGALHEPSFDFNALQLATSVFRCLGSRNTPEHGTGLCLIGWEAAGPHLRCKALKTHWQKRLHFNQHGHQVATALVNLACLDPRTATTTEMDRLDYRFICTSCPVVAFSGFQGREAYNWRDAVLHHIEKTIMRYSHSTQTWTLLTADAEADIKLREEPDPYTTDLSWSCARCPEHFQNMVSREEAITHVKFKHNINTPVENTDFFYFITRDGRTPRRRVGFPRIPPSE